MTPLIALTTYPPDEKRRFHLYANYVAAVRQAGAIPVLVAPGEACASELLDRVDGLILTGGGDLDSAIYAEPSHPRLEAVDEARDELEQELCRAILGRDLPCLAICRGMQVLNVVLGGTLIEDLEGHVPDPRLHRLPDKEAVSHPIEVESNSRLHRLIGETRFSCMSKHHQAVGTLAQDLNPVARAPDGVVEGVEHRSHPWLFGVQWHPEMTADSDRVQLRLFQALTESAHQYRDNSHG